MKTLIAVFFFVLLINSANAGLTDGAVSKSKKTGPSIETWIIKQNGQPDATIKMVRINGMLYTLKPALQDFQSQNLKADKDEFTKTITVAWDPDLYHESDQYKSLKEQSDQYVELSNRYEDLKNQYSELRSSVIAYDNQIQEYFERERRKQFYNQLSQTISSALTRPTPSYQPVNQYPNPNVNCTSTVYGNQIVTNCH